MKDTHMRAEKLRMFQRSCFKLNISKQSADYKRILGSGTVTITRIFTQY